MDFQNQEISTKKGKINTKNKESVRRIQNQHEKHKMSIEISTKSSNQSIKLVITECLINRKNKCKALNLTNKHSSFFKYT